MKTKTSIRTKHVLYVAVLLFFPLLIISCTTKPEVPSKEEAKVEILAKIDAAGEKWSQGITTGYVECAAEDIVWIDDLEAPKPIQGSANLKKYLETYSGKIPNHQHKIVDPLFQFYDDIVIVTYYYQGIFEGEPGSPWKVTSVYRYANSDWLSVHENWSTVEK